MAVFLLATLDTKGELEEELVLPSLTEDLRRLCATLSMPWENARVDALPSLLYDHYIRSYWQTLSRKGMAADS